MAALLAAHASEAVGKDAAVEVGAKLLLDVARQTGAVGTLLAHVGKEGGQLVLDDLVEDGLLRLATAVAMRQRGLCRARGALVDGRHGGSGAAMLAAAAARQGGGRVGGGGHGRAVVSWPVPAPCSAWLVAVAAERGAQVKRAASASAEAARPAPVPGRHIGPRGGREAGVHEHVAVRGCPASGQTVRRSDRHGARSSAGRGGRGRAPTQARWMS